MPFVDPIAPGSVKIRKLRTVLIALLMLLLLFCAMFWSSRNGRQHEQFELTFMRVSRGQPLELYYRDHNKLVPGGRSLDWLQGRLQRVGLKVDFVRARTLFSGETNRVCVVMGFNGTPLSSSANATIRIGSDQIPLGFRTQWTKPGTDQHLIMWQSAQGIIAPKRGTLIVTDPRGEAILIQRRF
jgi:hypothetical protein